jgi:hypothetical protein
MTKTNHCSYQPSSSKSKQLIDIKEQTSRISRVYRLILSWPDPNENDATLENEDIGTDGDAAHEQEAENLNCSPNNSKPKGDLR